MSPTVHRAAEKLVRERKAQTYSEACSMLAKRRSRHAAKRTAEPPPTPMRLPYKDD